MVFRTYSYPSDSPNLYKSSWDFWDQLEMDLTGMQDLEVLSNTLKTTRLERKPVNEYRKDFTKLGTGIEGEVCRDALHQVNLMLQEGQNMTIRAFEASSWPEEFYDIQLTVVDSEDLPEKKREGYERGSIMLTDVPPEIEQEIDYGKPYDFTPIHVGDYVVDPVYEDSLN